MQIRSMQAKTMERKGKTTYCNARIFKAIHQKESHGKPWKEHDQYLYHEIDLYLHLYHDLDLDLDLEIYLHHDHDLDHDLELELDLDLFLELYLSRTKT